MKQEDKERLISLMQFEKRELIKKIFLSMKIKHVKDAVKFSALIGLNNAQRSIFLDKLKKAACPGTESEMLEGLVKKSFSQHPILPIQNVDDNLSRLSALNLDIALARYNSLKEELFSHPIFFEGFEGEKPIKDILESVVREVRLIKDVDEQDFFARVSDKACYANTRVASGAMYEARIRETVGFNLEDWSNENQIKIIYRYTPGSSAISNKNFHIAGALSHELLASQVGRSRLFVIQNLARYCVMKCSKGMPLYQKDMMINFHRLILDSESIAESAKPFENAIEKLVKKVGVHFSSITAAHCFTPFGGLKNDIHVVNFVNNIANTNFKKAPSQREGSWIIGFVCQLLKRLLGQKNQYSELEIARALRKMDIIMMSISRAGLIPKIT
ncbi:hypothetical protein N9U32_01315 [Pseudomonadota bacterium]|jgi:hypothetical protein|nr:hypothetical protein [Pseudomonadota bacterium]